MPPRKTNDHDQPRPDGTARRDAKSPAPAPKRPRGTSPPPRPEDEGHAPVATPRIRPPAPPCSLFADLGLTRAWMPGWASEAVHSGDVEAACASVGVSLAEFAEARGQDPAFDELCRMHDQIVDLRIMEKLRADALRGDARALALYFGRVREIVLHAEDARQADDLVSAEVAERMIRAGLDAHPGDRPAIRPPALKLSRRRAQSTRDSRDRFEEI